MRDEMERYHNAGIRLANERKVEEAKINIKMKQVDNALLELEKQKTIQQGAITKAAEEARVVLEKQELERRELERQKLENHKNTIIGQYGIGVSVNKGIDVQKENAQTLLKPVVVQQQPGPKKLPTHLALANIKENIEFMAILATPNTSDDMPTQNAQELLQFLTQRIMDEFKTVQVKSDGTTTTTATKSATKSVFFLDA